MTHGPVPPATTTPVFTDPSGRRTTLLRWAAWGVCGAFAVVVGLVVLTLTTQVHLPGLGGLSRDRAEGDTHHHAAARADSPAAEDGRGLTVPGATGSATTAAAQAGLLRAPDASPAAAPTPTPAQVHASGAAAAAPAPGASSAPTPAGSSPGGPTPASPSSHANPHATTKTRNPQAAARKPSPRSTSAPSGHGATGLGNVTTTDAPTAPPGQSK